MPKFLDLFVNAVREKRERMSGRLKRGRMSSLDNDLKTLFAENWHPLPDRESRNFHLLAVDGSVGSREYANGARFYVARAYGLTNKGEAFRSFETDVFLARGREEDMRRYVTMKAEHAEMRLALQAVPHLKGSRNLILIDGSLYGRMMHFPGDVPVEGDRSFVIKYMDTFSQLLSACRRENILLVGVSKHSRAEFLRNELLDQIYMRELRSLSSTLPPRDIRTLESCVKNVDKRPSASLRGFRRIKTKYGSLLDKFEEVLIEYRCSRPDSQLICNFASQSGYSTPMELGPAREQAINWLRSMMKDPEGYVRRRFKNSIADNINREDEFIEYGVDIIQRMLEFPTIVSFHLLFDHRDTPLRIDAPSWSFGVNNTLSSFVGTHLVEGFCGAAEELISVLKSGYAGLRDYNVWLKEVDEEVRLHRTDMDALYERLLEKELGLTLIHSRGYRRVKYP